jgi:hypothetical protein
MGWFQANGTPVPVRYLISDRPVRSPVGMYHTHNPGSHLITNAPTASGGESRATENTTCAAVR